VKRILLALAGVAIAAASLAQLTKYKDWDKSPEAYFLTSGERADWKKVATDQDAEQFIATYWAKRGGEAFKQEIARRIAAADQQFKLARYRRGAESVRGHLLVVLGPPSRVSQQRAQDNQADDTGGVTAPAIDTRFQETSSSVLYTWTYDKARLDPSLGISELKAQINVDNQRGLDELRNGSQAEKAMATVAEKSIVNPNATVNPANAAAAAASPAVQAPSASAAAPPAGATAAAPGRPGGAPATSGAPAAGGAPATGAPAAAGAAAAAPPPPPAAALPLPDAVKSALVASAPKGSGEAGFWSGVFRSNSGDSFLAVQFYLPSDKQSLSPGAPLKLGGMIEDQSGKEVQSFWEDANFSEVAEGNRKDRVVDRSVALPPGTYKGTFGVFAAEGQPPVTAATVPFELPAPSSDFQVSPLILSSGLVPLTRRPGPTDPFVFGTEKPIKVEPKGDHNFSKQDSLWYFYAVANPGLPAGAAAPAPAAGAAPAAAPTPAATPAAGAAAPAPGAAAPGAAPAEASAAAAKPRIMTRINVQRDGQDAFAPFTGPADMQPIGPSYFATGSEIPLASFEPGYYTFIINVRDLNAARGSAANKGLERKQDFVVLMPDGSLPARKAAAAPAPAAKATPKKP
jgi:GWxTD domain-containing protein